MDVNILDVINTRHIYPLMGGGRPPNFQKQILLNLFCGTHICCGVRFYLMGPTTSTSRYWSAQTVYVAITSDWVSAALYLTIYLSQRNQILYEDSSAFSVIALTLLSPLRTFLPAQGNLCSYVVIMIITITTENCCYIWPLWPWTTTAHIWQCRFDLIFSGFLLKLISRDPGLLLSATHYRKHFFVSF